MELIVGGPARNSSQNQEPDGCLQLHHESHIAATVIIHATGSSD